MDELAAALNDDASFSTTITNSIATKLPLAGGTMSGALNMGSQNITNAGTIAGGAVTTTSNLSVGTTNTSQFVTILKDHTGYTDIGVSNNTSNSDLYLGVGGSGAGNTDLRNAAYVLAGGASSSLVLGTNTDEKMRILASGNVGIGTNNPNQIFHIKNTGQHTTMRIENGNADFLIQAGDAGDDGLHFYDNANTAYRMTIDNAGQVGIGTTSPSTVLDVNGVLGVGNARVHETRINQTLALTTAAQRGGMSINSWYNSAAGPIIDFNISRNNTAGSHTVVQTHDALGTIIFRGDDGDEFVDSAAIEANVDAAPGNNDMPGRLVFYTSPDGTTGLQERMRIDNQGAVTVAGNLTAQNVIDISTTHTTQTTSANQWATIQNTNASGYSELKWMNNASNYLIMGTIGSTYSATDLSLIHI